LYSLPFTVVKSSENAADAKNKNKNINSFVCTCRLAPVRSVLKYQYFSQGELPDSGALNSQMGLPYPRRIRPTAN
jgi:hypothetical protein